MLYSSLFYYSRLRFVFEQAIQLKHYIMFCRYVYKIILSRRCFAVSVYSFKNTRVFFNLHSNNNIFCKNNVSNKSVKNIRTRIFSFLHCIASVQHIKKNYSIALSPSTSKNCIALFMCWNHNNYDRLFANNLSYYIYIYM